jgi:O-antigen ligase
MTVAMTATGGLLGLVVLVGLLGGLWLRGWVERRQRQPLSTEPETSAATRAAVVG